MRDFLFIFLNLGYTLLSKILEKLYYFIQLLLDLILRIINKLLWSMYKTCCTLLNVEVRQEKCKLDYRYEILLKQNRSFNSNIVSNVNYQNEIIRLENLVNTKFQNIENIICKLQTITEKSYIYSDFTNNLLFKDLLFITEKFNVNDYEKFSRFVDRFIFLMKDFSANFYEKLIDEEKKVFVKWLLRQHAGIDVLSKEEVEHAQQQVDLAKSLIINIDKPVNLSKIGYDVDFYVKDEHLIWRLIMDNFITKHYKHGNIHVNKGDVVLDGGCFAADSALVFACDTGWDCEIHSFEIDSENIKLIENNIALNPRLKNIIKVNELALSDISNKTLSFMHSDDNIASSTISDVGNKLVKTISIDDYVERNNLKKVDFIKMDIEGSELAALIGASETIKKFKPKLAICVYHKVDDCKTIPEFILKCNHEYKLHFGWHGQWQGEWSGIDAMLYAE